jgi:hypothetical protein
VSDRLNVFVNDLVCDCVSEGVMERTITSVSMCGGVWVCVRERGGGCMCES